MLYRDHCYHAADFKDEIRTLSDCRKLAAEDRIIQYPFVPIATDEKTEEELARQAEKRKESGKRLQEQAAKQRLEKV